jgi:hypothetical protein
MHGGYWRSLDKSDFSWLAPPFVQRQVAVALLNYGLAPNTAVEDIVRQQLAAIAWLYRNGDRLGFDPERIVVAGHSGAPDRDDDGCAVVSYARTPPPPRQGRLAVSALRPGTARAFRQRRLTDAWRARDADHLRQRRGRLVTAVGAESRVPRQNADRQPRCSACNHLR